MRMRLQATPGRTDYVMKKNDNEMRSLEQTFKQQLLEFDQQSLRDFDKKIEEQQIILQQAGVPGFFPTQSQQQLAQQGQILDFIVQKIKETEKALQQQSRFEMPQSSFQQPRPQERIVTIQKNVQPVVQQTRDPRLPNMEVTIPGGGNMNVPQQSQQLDPLMLLQNQPDILAGLMQNNPAALLIATQGTPQQKQELLNRLQSNALLIAAQGTPQQQQELMNQLIAQQQQQNIGLPNLGMGIPSIGQPPQQQNTNFGMPPPPMGPIGGPPMNSLNNTNANFMSPQQQLMNQLQNITNSSANPNNPLLLPGINNSNNPLPQQQMQSQQQQYNNNMNNNQFRGGYSKRGGGRPYNNRGRF